MNSRFRSIAPDSHTADEDRITIDLTQFEADLAASNAELNEQARRNTPPVSPAADGFLLPPLDLPDREFDRSTPAPLPTTSTPPLLTASGASFDLLSELRQAAEEKSKVDNEVESDRRARIDQTERAMRTLFRYLTEFASHLNKIQPHVPQTFRPLPNVELSALRWTESFIDFRTLGGTEISPLDSITMQYTLDAGNQVRVDKLPNYAAAYLEEVKRVGLRHTVTEKRSTRGMVEQISFAIDRLISVSLKFKADPDKMQIYVQARNFTGLGHANYFLPIREIDQALLDELGKQILGRPNLLFQRLIKQ